MRLFLEFEILIIEDLGFVDIALTRSRAPSPENSLTYSTGGIVIAGRRLRLTPDRLERIGDTAIEAKVIPKVTVVRRSRKGTATKGAPVKKKNQGPRGQAESLPRV